MSTDRRVKFQRQMVHHCVQVQKLVKSSVMVPHTEAAKPLAYY